MVFRRGSLKIQMPGRHPRIAEPDLRSDIQAPLVFKAPPWLPGAVKFAKDKRRSMEGRCSSEFFSRPRGLGRSSPDPLPQPPKIAPSWKFSKTQKVPWRGERGKERCQLLPTLPAGSEQGYAAAQLNEGRRDTDTEWHFRNICSRRVQMASS